MAITTQQRRCALTIQASRVAGSSHTDFPVLLTEATLPAEIFSLAQTNGGDIRFAADDAGTTELAFDLDAFDTGGSTARIFVKVPTLSGVSNTTIYVFYDTTATETGYADTDTYGRNAVWSDYVAVYHGSDLTNAAGSAGALTAVGNAAANAAGRNGGAFTFDGTGDYFDTSLVPMTGSADRAITMLVNRDVTSDVTFLSWGRTLAGQRWTLHLDVDRLRTSVQSGYSRASTAIATSAWAHIGQVFTDATASDIDYHLNGSADAFDNGTTRAINTASDSALRLGGDHFGEEIYSGLIEEVRIRDTNVTSVTADWIATEYDNLLNPGLFVIEGTPESLVSSVDADPAALDQISALEALVAGQAHVVAMQPLAQSAVLDGMGVGQVHILQPADLAAVAALSEALVSQLHVVALSEAAQDGVLEAISVGQVHSVGLSDLDQVSALDTAFADTLVVVPTADLVQAQILSGLGVSQAHAQAIAALGQQQSLSSLAIAQLHSLGVEGLFHASIAESAGITVEGIAAPAKVILAQLLDAIDVTTTPDADVSGLVAASFLDAATAEQLAALSPTELVQLSDVGMSALSQAHDAGASPLTLLQALDSALASTGLLSTPQRRTLIIETASRSLRVGGQNRRLEIN